MADSYFAYILQCNNGTKYYGHTDNLARRIKQHQQGKVMATKSKQPELAYYEKFLTHAEAYRKELSFKNGKTRKSTINTLIDNFGKSKCQGSNP